MNADEQEVIFRAQNVTEAHLIKNMLEAEGIEAFIFDDHLASLNPLWGIALGGIRVVVSSKDAAQAKNRLKEFFDAEKTSPPSEPTLSIPSQARSIPLSDPRSVGWFVGFVVFAGMFLFLSPGKLAVLFHRTIPLAIRGNRGRFRLDEASSETRIGLRQSLDVLLKSAQSGNLESQCFLGWKYYFGEGVKQSDSEAVQWFQRAASAGFPKAEYFLGSIYLHGLCGVQQDAKTALSWVQRAADQGLAPAENMMGSFYETGVAVSLDYGKAVEWYRRAVAQGDALSEAHLAYCYAEGLGVEKNFTLAASLDEIAAMHGNPMAQYNLGTLYELGHGVEKDPLKAYAWFVVAATRRDAKAIEAMTDWQTRLTDKEIAQGRALAALYEEKISTAPFLSSISR